MMAAFFENWMLRHQNRTSFALHMLGIPMTFIGVGWGLLQNDWLIGALLFVAGYGLQFIGHAIEGNDAGELILLKKLLGWPYVDIVGPKSAPPAKS